MPDGIEMKVEIRGMRQVQQMLRRLAVSVGRGGGSTALHARYAVIASQWVDRNFQQEGKLAGGWKALRPNTLAGRRKGSGRILQDMGLMRASFLPAWDDQKAVVGSADPKSLWHEKGTKPYPIDPKKPGGLLWFNVATRFGIRTKILKSGRRLTLPFAEGHLISTRHVDHPGLPSRRLLPRESELMPQILKTTLSYLREQERARGE